MLCSPHRQRRHDPDRVVLPAFHPGGWMILFVYPWGATIGGNSWRGKRGLDQPPAASRRVWSSCRTTAAGLASGCGGGLCDRPEFIRFYTTRGHLSSAVPSAFPALALLLLVCAGHASPSLLALWRVRLRRWRPASALSHLAGLLALGASPSLGSGDNPFSGAFLEFPTTGAACC